MNSYAVQDRLDLALDELKSFLKVEHSEEDDLLQTLLFTAKEQTDLFLNNDFMNENKEPEEIPFTVKLAVMKMVATWYEQRQDHKTSENLAGYSYNVGEVPWSSLKLLHPYKKLVGL